MRHRMYDERDEVSRHLLDKAVQGGAMQDFGSCWPWTEPEDHLSSGLNPLCSLLKLYKMSLVFLFHDCSSLAWEEKRRLHVRQGEMPNDTNTTTLD